MSTRFAGTELAGTELAGTEFAGTEEERRALDAYIKLARAAASVDALVNRHLAAAGLTPSQFGALEALVHLGPLRQKTLGRKILKSSGNMTTVIDNLERRGLVARERDPDDRRAWVVRPTAAGRARIEAVFPRHVRRVVEAFAALDEGEQGALADLLRRLGRSAEEALRDEERSGGGEPDGS